jgi:integrase/recombinase XerD
MKVTAILKGMIDSNGQQPIQIRIYHEGKRTFHPTGIKVDPELFKQGKVLPSHPKARDHNEVIKKLIIQYQAQALEGFKKKVPKTFLFDYIKVCATKWDKIKSAGTIRIYFSQLEKLKGFTHNIQLSQIDNNFLYAYQSYLINIGNSQNTIWSSFKFLRTVLNDAVKEDLLDKSPFIKFHMPKYENPNKPYLLPDELKKIEKFCSNKICPKDLVFVGTWFLISCNTGLRLSDLRVFNKKKNIHSNRLVVKTAKTGELIGLPISDKLRAYFERIEYKPLHYTGEAYNRLLKLVAMGAGVDKNITSHIGRHTFSMTLANHGISQEVAAKLLGHSDLRSTSVYYKISNSRIDNEVKKLK